METTLKTIESPIDPAVMADLEAVCNAGGIVRDLELYRRVSGRADVVRREMLAKFEPAKWCQEPSFSVPDTPKASIVARPDHFAPRPGG